jgi:hypothetical protein
LMGDKRVTSSAALMLAGMTQLTRLLLIHRGSSSLCNAIAAATPSGVGPHLHDQCRLHSACWACKR